MQEEVVMAEPENSGTSEQNNSARQEQPQQGVMVGCWMVSDPVWKYWGLSK